MRKQHPDRKCGVTGCKQKYDAGGYCNAHYQRLRKYGDPRAGKPTLQELAERRAYVIGEIEWFKTFGVSGELIASELGYTKVESVRDLLHRWGRPDLAELFMDRQEENWFRQWLEGKHRVA